MHTIIDLIRKEGLPAKSQEQLNAIKSGEVFPVAGAARLYPRSMYRREKVFFCIAKTAAGKRLLALADNRSALEALKLEGEFADDGKALVCPFTTGNSRVLRELFPFTEPVSLRDKKTTIGCGDRLGRATAGQLRAAARYDVYPVLAQQSIRELTLTRRTYDDVVADAVFLVFQEGFEKGYGGDGDHLKTLEDIDTALAAGMPMITLDLTEVMHPEPADWAPEKVEAEFEELDTAVQEYVVDSYGDRDFTCEESHLEFGMLEAKRCALMYWDALEFSAVVDRKLRDARGDHYDLEISIDETTAPTVPVHHLFIAAELKARKISVNSMAPRFIGEFQKGIDYIGDLDEFEAQFRVHCDIAQAYGHYKVSIHSGSDKFSVYPVIGKYTQMRLHLKTAGTSWLEAVRTIAQCDPAFYRKLHKKAYEHFDDATKLYHITADLSKIPALESVADADLPDYLEQNESRQLLHITYGGLLNDPEIRDEFFAVLDREEEAHYANLEKHIGRHIELLGAAKA